MVGPWKLNSHGEYRRSLIPIQGSLWVDGTIWFSKKDQKYRASFSYDFKKSKSCDSLEEAQKYVDDILRQTKEYVLLDKDIK